MQPPRVTVLTAVRNGMPYLPETVASIQAQTFADWEYIIVDDASDDTTPVYLQQASANEPRIRVIRQPVSGGPFAAANAGLKLARGDYVVRSDADDLQPPHRIQTQLDFLRANPQFRACITPWHSFNERGMIPGAKSRFPHRPRALCWYLLLRTFASHSSLCVERTALEEIGGYAEIPAAADFRLISTLSRSGWLGVIAEVLSYVRRHANRISRHRGSVQTEMAVETMADHMRDLAFEDWPSMQLLDLWHAGHASVWPIKRGREAIRRWGQAWRESRALNSDDRKQLRAFETYHTWLFLRANARREPLLAALHGLRLCIRWPSLIARRVPRICQ